MTAAPFIQTPTLPRSPIKLSPTPKKSSTRLLFVNGLADQYVDITLQNDYEWDWDWDYVWDGGPDPIETFIDEYCILKAKEEIEEVQIDGLLDRCFQLEEEYYFGEAKKGKLSPEGRIGRKRKEKVKSSHPVSNFCPPIVSYTPPHLIVQEIYKAPTTTTTSTSTTTSTTIRSASTSTSTTTTSFNESSYTRQLQQTNNSTPHASGLSLAQLLEISNRELTPEDYELLLTLDNSVAKKTCSNDQVAQLKQTAFSKTGDDNVQCSICTFDYEEGDPLKHIQCGHFFHSDCIVTWLTDHSTQCPLCKKEVF